MGVVFTENKKPLFKGGVHIINTMSHKKNSLSVSHIYWTNI